MDNIEKDQLWMREALRLASHGRYTARPNPCVGAVLVKNDQIVARAWHQGRGEAHAEVQALEAAGENSRDATCYITLEPCAHHGYTPPCCEALVEAGVRRVVVSMRDPNPKVDGQGLAYLQEKGIEVSVGVLEEEARELNKAFIKRMTVHQPWLSFKLAMTLDGKISDYAGNSQWISDESARKEVQILRASHAAVISTATTVIADNSRLNVRELPPDFPEACKDKFKQPLRVLLDRKLDIDFQHPFFEAEGDILIYTQAPMEMQKRKHMQIVPMPMDENRYFSISAILEDLSQREINSVLVEAGGRFAAEMLQSALVDEWIIYMSSKVLGEKAKSAFAIDKALELSASLALKFQSVSMCGPDIKIIASKIGDNHGLC